MCVGVAKCKLQRQGRVEYVVASYCSVRTRHLVRDSKVLCENDI